MPSSDYSRMNVEQTRVNRVVQTVKTSVQLVSRLYSEGPTDSLATKKKDSLRAACRQACTNALPNIWDPKMTTCANIRGADMFAHWELRKDKAGERVKDLGEEIGPEFQDIAA